MNPITTTPQRFNPMAFQRAEISRKPEAVVAVTQSSAEASDAHVAAAVGAAIAVGFKPCPVDELMRPNWQQIMR